MPEKNETTGVEYPTVTIDGKELRVCCSLYAEFQLSRSGLTLAACLKIISLKAITGARDAHDIASLVDMWAACVSENYEGDAPTADQWARKVSALPDWRTKWGEIDAAVGVAIKKRFPVATLPAAQPETAPALTN